MSLIPPLLPCTPFLWQILTPISALLLSQHYCALPAIATLSSSWSSVSYLEEEGFFHSQPRLGIYPCLSHNPADPMFQSSKQIQERRQAYRLHCLTGSKQQCSASWSFTTYFDNSCYMLTELTGEREASILRIPATRASFQHRENGFPSCQLSET